MDDEKRVIYAQFMLNQMRNSGIYAGIALTYLMAEHMFGTSVKSPRVFRGIMFAVAAVYVVFSVMFHVQSTRSLPEYVRKNMRSWLSFSRIVAVFSVATPIVVYFLISPA